MSFELPETDFPTTEIKFQLSFFGQISAERLILSSVEDYRIGLQLRNTIAVHTWFFPHKY